MGTMPFFAHMVNSLLHTVSDKVNKLIEVRDFENVDNFPFLLTGGESTVTVTSLKIDQAWY